MGRKRKNIPNNNENIESEKNNVENNLPMGGYVEEPCFVASSDDNNIISQEEIDNLLEKNNPLIEMEKVVEEININVNRIKSNHPDWSRILNAYYKNPSKPDFRKDGYVVTVGKKQNKTILKWNGKEIEV